MAAMAAQAFAVAGGRPVAEPARGGGGMGVLPAAGDSDSDGELAEEARPNPSRAAVPHHVDASGMWQRQVRLAWSPPSARGLCAVFLPCSPLPSRLLWHGCGWKRGVCMLTPNGPAQEHVLRAMNQKRNDILMRSAKLQGLVAGVQL